MRFELQTKEEIEALLSPLKKQHSELELNLIAKSEFPVTTIDEHFKIETPERDEAKIFCYQWDVSSERTPITDALSKLQRAPERERQESSSLDSVKQVAEDYAAALIYLQLG